MADQSTRNTPLLNEIIGVIADQLPDKSSALARLEQHFRNDYILNAGNADFVASAAESLRLAITKEELPLVLDCIAQKSMVGITIDHVETAINDLFDNRFIEL